MKKEPLAIVYVETGGLIPYARNSRTHSAEQVSQIAASIKEFGFTNPILTDGESGVIAGHGRLMAAQKLGLTQVPTIDLSHLSEAQKRAYVIADNRIALNSSWDEDMLKIELEDLQDFEFDLGLLGFNPGELSTLLGSDDDLFDEDLELDEDDEEKDKTKTDEGYAEFAIVLTVDNKELLLKKLNAIKNEQALDTNEDALMWMVAANA